MDVSIYIQCNHEPFAAWSDEMSLLSFVVICSNFNTPRFLGVLKFDLFFEEFEWRGKYSMRLLNIALDEIRLSSSHLQLYRSRAFSYLYKFFFRFSLEFFFPLR